MASSPPTQIAILPDAAPDGPPLTGLSSRTAPRSANSGARLRIRVGELVEKSNSGWPRDIPASSPLSPRTTDSNSRGPGSEVKTISVAAATALGESAHSAPAAQIFSAACRRASCTTSSWPPLRRLADIPEPIRPRPMNPTRMSFPSLIWIGDAEPCEDPPLQRLHALGCGAAALVIVAQQMECAMHDEVGDMVGGCLVLRPRLAPNGLPGEQNIAQEDALARWIRQHVGRLVLAAVAGVQRTHAPVVGQSDGEGSAA